MAIWIAAHWQLISLPIIGAMIGWVTNYLAIKMLFRPRREINILGLRIQGLVPRRQQELAANIAETVERDLISHRDVQQVLQSSVVDSEIESAIEQQVDHLLNKTVGQIPVVAMVLRAGPLQQIKQLMVAQLHKSTPEMIDRLMGKVEEQLDFRKIVQKKIEAFDLAKLEEIIYTISGRELKTIEVLGGVLGFMVGLIQVALMVMY